MSILREVRNEDGGREMVLNGRGCDGETKEKQQRGGRQDLMSILFRTLLPTGQRGSCGLQDGGRDSDGTT